MEGEPVTSRQQPVGDQVSKLSGINGIPGGMMSNGFASPAFLSSPVANSKPPTNSSAPPNSAQSASAHSAPKHTSSSQGLSSASPLSTSSSNRVASSSSSTAATASSHKSSSSSSSQDVKKDHHKTSSSSSSSSSKDKVLGDNKLSSLSGSGGTPVSSKPTSSSSSTSGTPVPKDKLKDAAKEKHSSSSSSSKTPSDKPKDSSSSSSSSAAKIKTHESSSKHDHVKKEHSSSSDKNKDGHVSSKSQSSDKIKKDSQPANDLLSMGNKLKVEAVTPVKMANQAPPGSSPVKATIPKLVIKKEKEKTEDSDDDVPLMKRMENMKQSDVKKEPTKNGQEAARTAITPTASKDIKAEPVVTKRSLSDDSDEEPLVARMTKKTKPTSGAVKKVKEEKGKKRKASEETPEKKSTKKVKVEETPTKKGEKKEKKTEEEETKWRWWEEIKTDNSVKWHTLQHKGPVFAPPYDPLPPDILFRYNGKVMKLSLETEEVATFYAKMLDHEYTTREIFNKNFFKDWRKVMTDQERSIITDLTKCDFKEMAAYFKLKAEERKAMTKEQKQEIKKANEALQKEYGFCIIDGHKQKIGNFKIEPPGLFRGRGNHPKQGMLKRRVMPSDVSINCSSGVVVSPPPGHKWKDVRNDNTVTWLASWTENVQGQTKYVMLNAASKLKGQKDWQKYETARRLHVEIDKIRETYREDWKSKEMRIRQRAVALYFIDKLALRAGNEKDEDQADTVGCCSLRVEHIKLHEEYEGQEFVVEFDFLGKDSIRYYNRVPVEKRVFKNLQLFMENKSDGDDLFDRLNTMILNKHLQSLMDGLTAKVFRTYNASVTLEKQLDLLTVPDDLVPAKLLSYNRANRAVAVLCNHQRAAPKNFEQQMGKIQEKIEAKVAAVKAAKKEMKAAKADYKHSKTEKSKKVYEQKKKTHERLNQQLTALKVQQTDRDENKEIALGTSKLNYLDPRISVAWCKKWNVPIEKVYNKTQRDKFAWAIDMAESSYRFTEPGVGGPMPEEDEEDGGEEDDE